MCGFGSVGSCAVFVIARLTSDCYDSAAAWQSPRPCPMPTRYASAAPGVHARSLGGASDPLGSLWQIRLKRIAKLQQQQEQQQQAQREQQQNSPAASAGPSASPAATPAPVQQPPKPTPRPAASVRSTSALEPHAKLHTDPFVRMHRQSQLLRLRRSSPLRSRDSRRSSPIPTSSGRTASSPTSSTSPSTLVERVFYKGRKLTASVASQVETAQASNWAVVYLKDVAQELDEEEPCPSPFLARSSASG